jgi:hypothetical protein
MFHHTCSMLILSLAFTLTNTHMHSQPLLYMQMYFTHALIPTILTHIYSTNNMLIFTLHYCKSLASSICSHGHMHPLTHIYALTHTPTQPHWHTQRHTFVLPTQTLTRLTHQSLTHSLILIPTYWHFSTYHTDTRCSQSCMCSETHLHIHTHDHIQSYIPTSTHTHTFSDHKHICTPPPQLVFFIHTHSMD